MLFFYVRHGHPTYNPDCLTEEGFREAEALVSRMEIVKPDKIFSSTSTRAYQTAEPTAKALGKEITRLEWCHEGLAWQDFAVPNSEGKTFWCFGQKSFIDLFSSDEIRKLDKNWYDHPKLKEYNFKKGINRIQKESDAFLESLGYRHEGNRYKAIRPNDDRIALFAHQGFGLAFLSALLDVPYPMFCTHFDMTYTGMTVIEFKGDGFVVPKVLQLSNDSHLFASDMETVYNNTYRF